MNGTNDHKEIEHFLRDNPAVMEVLQDQDTRNALHRLSKKDISRIDYLMKNPWIDLGQIVKTADSIMNISPEIPGDELLALLCKHTANLARAQSATCRTYDPIRNVMVASGSYKWGVERTEEIPYESSIAGKVIKEKDHYCVPDIRVEGMYQEKEKLLAMGIHSMLAIPISLTDYEGSEKRDVLLGTLQLYFEEENKTFYPQEIKLIKSIVNRVSYVLALKRNLALQKRAMIIRESRRALVSVLKRTQSLDQVLNFLVARIAEILGVNRCSLFSIENDPREKSFAVLIAGYPLLAHKYGVILSFDEHPAFREVCEAGEPLRIEDARNDPRMKASYELYLHQRIENVYFFPLKDEKDAVTNVLVLDGDESRPLESNDLFFCNALIQDIELCIQASLRSQERHDYYNQMLSFSAIARLFTKKLSSREILSGELGMLYKKLYKSMLAVENITTDQVPFAQKEQCDLNEIILERLEAYYFSPGISIAHSLAGKQVIITADKKKVGRIIGNLLDNAHRKLEELKTGTLKIASYIESGCAVIEVGNSGAIPPDIQKKILHEEAVIHRQHAEKGGLGLSIVKLFTAMHNGLFEFRSFPEEDWTVFIIRLPVN